VKSYAPNHGPTGTSPVVTDLLLAIDLVCNLAPTGTSPVEGSVRLQVVSVARCGNFWHGKVKVDAGLGRAAIPSA
jgi:hypothetical protein